MALVSNKDKEMCNINHSKLWVREPELAQATGSEVKEVPCNLCGSNIHLFFTPAPEATLCQYCDCFFMVLVFSPRVEKG